MPVPHLRPLATTAALLAGGLLAGPLLAVPAGAADGGRPLSATLTGAAERPGPGDPDGSGTAQLRVSVGQERVCVDLAVADIGPATAAHIHVAPADAPGPIVVPLVAPTSGTSSDCYDITRELAKALVQHPEDYYVNVHNADFPAGAVRGQLG